jgi:hypothetical protein
VRAAWVPEVAAQPVEAVLDQGDGPQTGFARFAAVGILPAEQLHQAGCQLLGRASGRLILDGVPFAITDRQTLQQSLSEIKGPLRPSGG